MWGLTTAFCTESGAPVLLPYQFRMEEIEGFRYRCRVSGAGGELWGSCSPWPGVLTLHVSPGCHALSD